MLFVRASSALGCQNRLPDLLEIYITRRASCHCVRTIPLCDREKLCPWVSSASCLRMMYFPKVRIKYHLR